MGALPVAVVLLAASYVGWAAAAAGPAARQPGASYLRGPAGGPSEGAAPEPAAPRRISYETRWFEQTTDHFSWANQDTFRQRYLVNAEQWCGSNCPILFYCGNEGDIELFANNTGWMWEKAHELHAMLVFAEHRFYGQSMPYPVDLQRITPADTKTLGYLSSEQALADYARLIYELKHNVFASRHSPVIAVGGSYGGMLAAWMRMKYPNAVVGALAGSAPILQFPGEYDCSLFNRIVTKDFQDYSANCSRSIAKSWSAIRNVAGQSGARRLGDIFRTCEPVADQSQVELLLQMLAGIYVNLAMTDYANEASFLSKMPAYPIKHVCSRLKDNPAELSELELVRRLALATQVYTNYTGQARCLDVKGILFDPMDVLWDFQSCTEMVMPICSDGVNDMFDPQPFNLSAFVEDCKQRLGVNTQVNKVKILYGDRHIYAASNIIFSSCSRDPWSAGCPQESNEPSGIHAIQIAGACHHEDLRFSGPNDSAELRKARQQELNIIGDWIQNHYDQIRKFEPNDTFVFTDSVSMEI